MIFARRSPRARPQPACRARRRPTNVGPRSPFDYADLVDHAGRPMAQPSKTGSRNGTLVSRIGRLLGREVGMHANGRLHMVKVAMTTRGCLGGTERKDSAGGARPSGASCRPSRRGGREPIPLRELTLSAVDRSSRAASAFGAFSSMLSISAPLASGGGLAVLRHRLTGRWAHVPSTWVPVSPTGHARWMTRSMS